MSTAGLDILIKQPVLAGAEGGAIAAVMSIPGTAKSMKYTPENMGVRTAQADEQGAFKTLRVMEAKGMGEQIRIDSAVNAYAELINLPEQLLPQAKLESLQTAYRVYEASATPENAAKLMQRVSESIKVAAEGVKSGAAVDSTVAETVARLEWVQGNIDSARSVGDNGIVSLSGRLGISETKTEGTGKTKYDDVIFDQLTEQEKAEIAEDIRVYGGSPIEIPETAEVKDPKTMRAGYQQVSYKWNDGLYSYEARWHTETPGAAKYGRGTTWVVTRRIPGNAKGVMSILEYKVGEGWIDIEMESSRKG